MSEVLKRPSNVDLLKAYERLFSSGDSEGKLRNAAFEGRLLGSSELGDSVVGRSMAWKLFLLGDGPLKEPPNDAFARPPMEDLEKLRGLYVTLLLDKMRAPDGGYEEGFSIPGVGEMHRSPAATAFDLNRNNPLSLDEANPWKEWFTAVELRRTIRQDVERTFPDIDYFRSPSVQEQLSVILFLHATLHPDIGYRQGMHELLAPIYLAVDYDSIPEEGEDEDVRELSNFCSRTWVAADAWSIFTVVMEGTSSWYEWREPTLATLPPELEAQYRHDPSQPVGETRPYVAPIVLACQRLQSQMLKSADPVLWQAIQSAGTEPQIYGIRWLRLLFTREFSLSDAMLLWDGILACECRFELVPWICVAMLIRIRNSLIPADYTGQLTTLLRYPSPPQVTSNDPHHTTLLLRQAFALFTTSTPATGASIAVENQNFLGIPVAVPETPRPHRSRGQSSGRPSARRKSNADLRTGGSVGDSYSQPGKDRVQRQSVQFGIPEMFARGLMEKGEALGINKTVMNAVAELRKNIPDLAGQLMRSPASETAMLGSFPLSNEYEHDERPPWEPRTRLEMERDISELRALQRRLGEAVGVAVDSLLLDEGEDRDEEMLKKIKQRKREALESLAYVRDILNGPQSDIDEERLYGELEFKRLKEERRVKEKKALAMQRSASSSSPPLRPPEPAAARQALASEPRESSPPQPSHPLTSLPRSPPVSRTHFDTSSSRPFASTLPKRAAHASAPMNAPWNHTPSSFSISSSTLPRPPPPTSATLRPMYPPTTSSKGASGSDQAPRPRQASADPLGAIPPPTS